MTITLAILAGCTSGPSGGPGDGTLPISTQEGVSPPPWYIAANSERIANGTTTYAEGGWVVLPAGESDQMQIRARSGTGPAQMEFRIENSSNLAVSESAWAELLTANWTERRIAVEALGPERGTIDLYVRYAVDGAPWTLATGLRYVVPSDT